MLPARPLILFSTIKRSAGFCQPAFIISKKMFDKFGKTLYNNLCMTVKKGITMLLGLSKIIDCPGGAVSFETSLDLSDLAFGNCCPATEPVFASGTVRNTAGVLMLSGTVRTRLHGVCDRCARAFARDVEFPMEAVLVTALEDESNEDQEIFALQGNAADRVKHGFQAAVQPRLQGAMLSVRQKFKRRLLQLSTGIGSPLCCFKAASQITNYVAVKAVRPRRCHSWLSPSVKYRRLDATSGAAPTGSCPPPALPPAPSAASFACPTEPARLAVTTMAVRSSV